MIELKAQEQRLIIDTQYYQPLQRNKLCVISHFDIDSIVDNYVVFLLEELHKLKFDIVFVTTSEKITSFELLKIKKNIAISIKRKNHGYDFMSWKTALSLVPEYIKYEMILHINDSIFFPLTDPKKMFELMEQRQVDCWGLTDSFKQTHHLESFFWVANKKLLQSKAYEEFWNQCEIVDDKSEIIRQYEMGFAPFFLQHGFSCSAYIEQEKVLQKIDVSYRENNLENLEQKRSFNIFWDVIIKEFDAPFIKKKILLKSHPEYNPTTVEYKKVLKQYTTYDMALIEHFIEAREISNPSHTIRKAEEFFVNLSVFTKVLQELRIQQGLVLYGFGEVGYLIYSNLDKNIEKIVDRNYVSLTRRYQHIHKFCSIEDIEGMARIVIGALGREMVIKEAVYKKGVDNSNVICIADRLPFDALKFANNITKLLYHFDALYRLAVEKNYTLSFHSSSESLNVLIKNFLKMHGMQSINVSVIQDTNQIYFLIDDTNDKVEKIDFVFV